MGITGAATLGTLHDVMDIASAAAGLVSVVDEAKQMEQAAAAAAKADAAAAKAAAAKAGKATAAATKAAAAATRRKAKRVPKAAPQAAEPTQHIPAGTAIKPDQSLAQSTAAADAAAEHDEAEPQQQPAAASREERYRARNAGPAQQGPHQVQGLGQGHNQLPALTSPSTQGGARQARQSDTTGQPAGKRRKLEPAGLFESLDTGRNNTSAGDAEVIHVHGAQRLAWCYISCCIFATASDAWTAFEALPWLHLFVPHVCLTSGCRHTIKAHSRLGKQPAIA